MESIEKNQEVWRSLYKNGKADLLYPSDVFIRQANFCFREHKPSKVLDYGFGTGANLIYLASRGFEVSGLEISEEAISITKSRLDERNLTADLRFSTLVSPLPWESGYFGAIIAWQVLYYNDWNGWRFALGEIDRLLQPGGVFICAIAAPGDISQTNAYSLGNSLYSSRVDGQEGAIMLIPSREDLPKCFPGWSINIGKMEYEFGSVVAKHWVITWRKI